MSTATVTKASKKDRAVHPKQAVLSSPDEGDFVEQHEKVPKAIRDCVNDHLAEKAKASKAKEKAKEHEETAKEFKQKLPSLIEKHGKPNVIYFVEYEPTGEIYKACRNVEVTGSIQKAPMSE